MKGASVDGGVSHKHGTRRDGVDDKGRGVGGAAVDGWATALGKEGGGGGGASKIWRGESKWPRRGVSCFASGGMGASCRDPAGGRANCRGKAICSLPQSEWLWGPVAATRWRGEQMATSGEGGGELPQRGEG